MGTTLSAQHKEQVIEILRDPMTSGQPNRAIARFVGCHESLVRRLRQELQSEGAFMKKGKLVSLPISKLRFDDETQSRANQDAEVIENYTAAWKDKKSFPPIVVFQDGDDFWIGDGIHRALSARAAKRKMILADVRPGTKREAILYSASANADHGKQRTNDDKRKSVLTLLNDEEWHEWSNVQIADHCGVSESLVRSLRPESIFVLNEDRKAERNGKIYTINTGNIGTTKTSGDDASEASADSDAEIVTHPGSEDTSEGGGEGPPELIPGTPEWDEYHTLTPVPDPLDADEPANLQAETPEDGSTVPSLESDAKQTAPGAPAETSDAEWLATLPLWSQLENQPRRIFERDALKYRALWQSSSFRSFKDAAAKVLKEAENGYVRGPFDRRVSVFLRTPHPRDWVLCDGCKGKAVVGERRLGCDKCFSKGFQIIGNR